MKNKLNKIIFSILAGIVIFIIQIMLYGHCRADDVTPPINNISTIHDIPKVVSFNSEPSNDASICFNKDYMVLRKSIAFVNNEETWKSTVYTLEHPYDALNDFNRPHIHVTHIDKIIIYYALLLNHNTNKFDTIRGNTIHNLFFKIDKLTEFNVPKVKGFESLSTIQVFFSCFVFAFVMLLVGIIAIMFRSDKRKKNDK